MLEDPMKDNSVRFARENYYYEAIKELRFQMNILSSAVDFCKENIEELTKEIKKNEMV